MQYKAIIFDVDGTAVPLGSVLKEQADEIAPKVEDDGLAQIIEKYFLS